ncbi:hypothetical protein JCM21531_789 [Acetivibrio straminisolvens JCM 21531]|uniref:Uncharacterized protein n=1 Tax=Acetivibrio straminisolvens JCM 21531 TaxID=1294263 RepID=W4V3Y1_9FIRM|nr:hypothetical protein JCM21531_789 [Acetivibrio straminisolvens JCM 21531]
MALFLIWPLLFPKFILWIKITLCKYQDKISNKVNNINAAQMEYLLCLYSQI